MSPGRTAVNQLLSADLMKVLTGLLERFIIESRFSDLKCVPFVAIDLLVCVDNIQLLILETCQSGHPTKVVSRTIQS